MNNSGYRLATYARADGIPRAGIVVDQHMLDVEQELSRTASLPKSASHSVLSILSNWEYFNTRLHELARDIRSEGPARAGAPIASVTLLPPILYPGTIFCAGANYKDHVREMSTALNLPQEPDPHEVGLKPWHFIKPSAPCVRATHSRIVLPGYSRRVDWEAEIALVIGKPCRNVAESEALNYVAGLTIVNDLSARDHLKRDKVAPDSPFRFDWVSQKCFDGALPMGPWICPLDQLENLNDLPIQLWVNDELMQDSSSANLIFSFAEQVSHLSTRLTLQPGDVIATGTPAGCGAARGRFLQPGDRVRIRVDGIGELHNEFSA